MYELGTFRIMCRYSFTNLVTMYIVLMQNKEYFFIAFYYRQLSADIEIENNKIKTCSAIPETVSNPPDINWLWNHSGKSFPLETQQKLGDVFFFHVKYDIAII